MQKRNKGKIIIFIIILTAFFSWICMGPAFLSKHFHELDESYIEKHSKINFNEKIPVTYNIDKFELRENSYREIIEIVGFAFKELKQEIKNREISIFLESINGINNYIIKSQLMQRPDVLSLFLSGQNTKEYLDVGYYAKFSAIMVQNGNYKVNIIVKENGKMYCSDTKFIIKKDKGMVTILPPAN